MTNVWELVIKFVHLTKFHGNARFNLTAFIPPTQFFILHSFHQQLLFFSKIQIIAEQIRFLSSSFGDRFGETQKM